MTKRSKAVMLLGIISLLAPSITYAQRNLIKSGTALSNTPEFIRAIERGTALRQMGSSLGRTAAGIPAATMPSVYPILDKVSFTSFSQVELPQGQISSQKVLDIPSARMMATYNLTFVEAQAVAAGSYNNKAAVEQAVQSGAEPKFAFFGALAQGYLNLAGELIEKYGIDVNTPILNNQYIFELLPDLQQMDPRITWLYTKGLNPNAIVATSVCKNFSIPDWTLLINMGLNPDMVMQTGAYVYIHNMDVFKHLVQRGLNPMAADKNNFTALHWYVKNFMWFGGVEDDDFLIDWMAKFPDANPNVQDAQGNTPLHLLHSDDKNYQRIFRLKGVNPLIQNKQNRLPFSPHQGWYGRWTDYWQYSVRELREGLADLIIKYKYPGQVISAGKVTAIKKKAEHLSLFPEEMAEYFIQLGATPDELLQWITEFDNSCKNGWTDYMPLRGIKELQDILTNKYGAKLPQEQGEQWQWRKRLGWSI